MKNKYVHISISIIASISVFFVLNSVINLIVVNVRDLFNSDSFYNISEFEWSISSIVFNFSNVPSQVYLGLVIVSIVVGGLMLYKLRSNFKDLEESGSKGTSRFTTLEELKQQYRAVPEKKEAYKGGGGVPISRYKNKIFVDDSPVNNLWIGTTRSGKGEMGMFPMIDIYSRAEKKASMVLNDPKGELYATSKETLEKRGYHVEVLNLDNPLQSMSYQLLQLVIDAYEEGNMTKAEQYTKTISNMLYSDPSAKDKFWQDSASALCTALILGLCEKNIPNNKEKVTMYTVASTLNTLASEKEFDEVTGETTTGLDKFFDSLPENHPAKLQYATVKFASGAGQTVAGIFANAFDKLSIFTLTPIAKMTSMNSFEMRKIGFGKIVSGISKPLNRINIKFANGEETVRTDDTGLFSINHNEVISEGDQIEINVGDSNIYLILDVKNIDKDTGIINYEIIEESTESEIGIQLNRIEYFDKPTALFMITPDYDSSLHVIASLYVKQLYTELARTASNTSERECIREVIFILDEFGNMPTIEDMGSMVTVCLGRNIRFNLVIQAYSQLKQKYDKDWETIDGNCANTIYILTTNNDTAEQISKKLGEKTITSNSRSGGSLSLDKNKTEGTDGRRLLDANELMRLKEGEMVVIRGIKRQDIKRQKITSYPIFSTGETRMKYRYEYLSDDFNTEISINDIDIPCEHATLDLQDIIYQFNEIDEDEESNGTEESNTEQPTTINDLIGDDNIFPFITENIVSNTDMTEEDVSQLTPEEFLKLLEQLQEDELIATNTYNVVKEKVMKLSEKNKDEQDKYVTMNVNAE
ncbi:VirD4-like conjugal transfer protein, CD1115 family [Virgibacillus salexigens]|uniref:VirD4-like conjugal transfer protein, CD1115 family n=1 Tax=Virgibacillus massiliensis TaxID=1462526 RepID=UPI00136BE98E|nr:type IV secretory system conjugative DNA transfer family protein [Virgibacillus massiliensis]MYL43970.1 TraM recognition domain-containing protein [Virgibacillus massiliensis]